MYQRALKEIISYVEIVIGSNEEGFVVIGGIEETGGGGELDF